MFIKKEIQKLEYSFLKNYWYDLFWAYSSNFLSNWIEFSEITKYNFWDNLKNIDWKTTAKKDELYVKKFIEERNLNVLFIINISDTFDFCSENISKNDLLLEMLFTLISCSIHNNDNIWAYFYSDKIYEFINLKNSEQRLFDIITSFEKLKSNKNKSNINIIFEKLIKQKTQKNLIFILTDETDFEDNKYLKLLSNQNKTIIFNIFDKFEVNIQKTNSLISLKNEDKILNINLSDKNKIENYNKLIEEKLTNLKKYLIKSNVKYEYFLTWENIYNKLLKFFRD